MSEPEEWNRESAMSYLKSHYKIPGSAICFASANKIFHFFKKVLPIEDIESYLSSENTHTLFRENKKRARQHVPMQVIKQNI